MGRLLLTADYERCGRETLVVYCRIGLTLQYFLEGTEKKQVRH